MNYKLLVRLSLLLMTLFTSVLTLTSLYSATQIQVLPPSDIPQPVVSGETISSSVPLTVRNNGLYDIEEINIYIHIENSSHYLLFENMTSIPLIAAKSEETLNLGFTLNFTRFKEEGAYTNLFRDDNFTLSARVTCRYTLGLIGFGLNISQTIPWKAPIDLDSLVVIPRMDEASLGFAGESVFLTIPVDVSYSGWLSIPEVEILAEVYNSSDILLASSLTQVLNMTPGENRIPLVMIFPINTSRGLLTQDQELRVDSTLRVFGFEVLSESLNYSWGAPLSGLNFTDPSLSPVNATHMILQMGMEGRNNSPSDITNCTIQLQVFNSTGTLVGDGVTSFSLMRGTFSETLEVILPIGSAPSRLAATITVEGLQVGTFEKEVT